jgi:peptidoglycan/xylan/chitin deacetylase (PgdA/CDA1 family)
LCYHGFVLDDEDRFRESLFLTRAAFERRMRYLRERNFPILHLDEALERLRAGTLPANAIAVTIDDGFHSVHAVALEVLRAYRIPATLYLTSYYFQKGTPIFGLAVDYMFWKSNRSSVDLSGLGLPGFEDARALDFAPERRPAIAEKIIAHGNTTLDEPGRVALSRQLAARLGVDYQRIAESRILSQVSAEELTALRDAGVRIGLHTHRHRFPEDRDQAWRELEDNRQAVEPILGGRMVDFCYPSGDWSRAHWPVLRDNGVQSATTCESGLVYRDTAPFGLPRILDDNRVSQIELEAELSGFSELIRRVRGQRPPQAQTEAATGTG